MPATTGERLIGRNLEEIAPNHRARYEWAINVLLDEIPVGSTVLDAASGVGYGSWMMAAAGFNVVAIDRAEESRKYQKLVFAHERVEFFMADIYSAEGTFDAVVSVETIEHLADSREWIDHIGGMTDLLIGTVPNEDVVHFDKKKHSFHFRHFTQGQVIDLMEDWDVSDWATQYGKWKRFEMVPGVDGMTLGFVARKNNA